MYERVTYRPGPGQRARTIYLERPAAGERFLTGIEVNRHGDEVASAGADERLHVIEHGVIVRRVSMVMHREYGELVPAGEEGS